MGDKSLTVQDAWRKCVGAGMGFSYTTYYYLDELTILSITISFD